MLTEVLNLNNYAVSPHSVGPWVVGSLIAILGIVTLIRERGSKVSVAFYGLTMSVAIWLLFVGVLYSTLDEPLALWWAKVEHLGVVVIPSLVLLFTLAIVQRVHEFRAMAWGSLALSPAGDHPGFRCRADYPHDGRCVARIGLRKGREGGQSSGHANVWLCEDGTGRQTGVHDFRQPLGAGEN